MQGQTSTQKNQNNQLSKPLLWLPKVSIAIFPDRIVQYCKSLQKLGSINHITLASINDLEQSEKVIQFLKSDIAFKIDENIGKKVQLEFQVEKHEELPIVQEVLRKKMCQIGFEEKYQMFQELGKGATAKVYLVERKIDRKKFAAKVISIKTSDNKQYESFINEAKILRCLNNKHIVSIESLYIYKKQLICVLEYLEGGTLLEELKNDLLRTNEEKFKAVKDITLGVEHMRQKRIAHRDLKLENIMIRINEDKSKDYVITDFGLATWIGETQLIYQKCGTPGYLAPEILRANKSKVIVSHSSDIFSLGVIFHFIFLLRAVFPFNGNPKQLLALNRKASFSLNTPIHMRLMNSEYCLLEKTLVIDPNKRISSNQLLDTYIKAYEKEVKASKKKEKEKTDEKMLHRTSSHENTARSRIQMGNSIEIIEKRAPSLQKKNQFTARLKTQSSSHNEKIEEKRESSVSKFLNKIWSKVTPSKMQSLKQKEQSSMRKLQMKNFLS